MLQPQKSRQPQKSASKETSISEESWNGLKAYQEKKRQEDSSSKDTSRKGFILTAGYASVVSDEAYDECWRASVEEDYVTIWKEERLRRNRCTSLTKREC